MGQPIGEMTLEILLKITEAEKGAKQITASLTNVDDVTKKLTKSSEDLSGKMGRLGFALQGLKDVGNILSSSLATIFNTVRNSNDAYQQYLSSTRQLEAASKLSGVSLDKLNKVSEQTKNQFKLTAGQSNLFAIELTKLAQKSGDVTKVQESISALMDLGAGQGLDAEQTLYAIKQAILGIDEGTDKLFQKNPSVLYDEFAKKIGTTAGKLTDQQKAQALLNAVLDSGGKLTGGYSKYLETAAGKQQTLNTQVQDAKIKLGEELQPVLLTFLTHVNNLINAYNGLGDATKVAVVGIGVFSTALIKAIPLIVTFKDSFGGILTSIKGLANEGVPGIKSFAGSIALNLGKGSVAFLAILAIYTLVDDLVSAIKDLIYWKNKMSSIEANQTKIDYSPNTSSDATKVPLQTDENGNLKILTQQEAEDFGIFPKDAQQYGPEITKEQRELFKQQSDIIDNNKKVSSTNKGVTDSYNEVIEKVRTYNDLLKELNAERSIEDIRARLLRQKEIDESTGRVKGYYGPDEKNKFSNKAGVRETEAFSFKDKLIGSLSLANQISSILGIGADNFVSKFLNGLQSGISLASSIAKILSFFGSGGALGIFSFLGFASGGSVPGSGTGDIVPAMLTPGEFVINKSRAGQLGTRFLNWLNGGGTVQSMAPGAFANMSTAAQIIQVPYILSHEVKGQNLKTIINRVDKSNGRRSL